MPLTATEQPDLVPRRVAIPGCDDMVEVARDARVVVLRAWQPAFQRHVSVHLLPETTVDQLEAASRRTGPLAGHPNVVTVHELGATAAGVAYLVTELLEPVTLGDRLRTEGPLDWYEACRVVVKVAGVVAAAASAGVTDLGVTPDEIRLSRFGEPKVAVLGSGPQPVTSAGLRALLRTLLGGGDDAPTEVGALLAGPDTDLDPADFARQVQAAQAAAGRPVTELPVDTHAVPVDPLPFEPGAVSSAVTVTPATSTPTPRARSRHAASVGMAAGVVVLTVVVALVASRQSSATKVPAAAAPTPTMSAAPPTTAPDGKPLEPPLYTANLAPGGGWNYNPSTVSQASFEDEEYRLHVNARSGTSSQVFRSATAENRLSTSLTARVSPSPLARVGVLCGDVGGGSKSLLGLVGPDGGWEIEVNGTMVSSGTVPPTLLPALHEAFTVRFDCVSDRNPTRAALFVNGTLVGQAAGMEPFPLRAIYFANRTRSAEPFDLAVIALTVRRLG